jgi:hypothetical protein
MSLLDAFLLDPFPLRVWGACECDRSREPAVGQAFQPAGAGDFPVARNLCGAGEPREPAAWEGRPAAIPGGPRGSTPSSAPGGAKDSVPPQTYCSLGMRTGTNPANPPTLVPQVLLRRNVIRETDGIADPPSRYTRMGLQVLSGGGVIIEENTIDASDPNPLSFQGCSSAGFFANQTPGGVLIQGQESSSGVKASEVSTDVEDAAVLAF